MPGVLLESTNNSVGHFGAAWQLGREFRGETTVTCCAQTTPNLILRRSLEGPFTSTGQIKGKDANRLVQALFEDEEWSRLGEHFQCS
jgi:hypothetical protein